MMVENRAGIQQFSRAIGHLGKEPGIFDNPFVDPAAVPNRKLVWRKRLLERLNEFAKLVSAIPAAFRTATTEQEEHLLQLVRGSALPQAIHSHDDRVPMLRHFSIAVKSFGRAPSTRRTDAR